jgi:hypothetical protein
MIFVFDPANFKFTLVVFFYSLDPVFCSFSGSITKEFEDKELKLICTADGNPKVTYCTVLCHKVAYIAS